MSAERKEADFSEVAAERAAAVEGEIQVPPAPGGAKEAPPAEPRSVPGPQPEPQPAAGVEGEASFSDAQAPPAEPEAPSEAVPALEDQLAAARDEAARYLALAQLTQADFENFRKRAAREAAASADRGTWRLAKELLPALDHLELALQASEQDPAAAELARGVRLVQQEVVKALAQAGIHTYSPHGEAFDPEQHEAMAQLPREGAETGTVLEVYQQGYRFNGSVLRPARVVVAE